MTIDAYIHDAGFDDACILDYPGSWSRIHGACVCICDRDIDQQQDKRVLGVRIHLYLYLYLYLYTNPI